MNVALLEQLVLQALLVQLELVVNAVLLEQQVQQVQRALKVLLVLPEQLEHVVNVALLEPLVQ